MKSALMIFLKLKIRKCLALWDGTNVFTKIREDLFLPGNKEGFMNTQGTI